MESHGIEAEISVNGRTWSYQNNKRRCSQLRKCCRRTIGWQLVVPINMFLFQSKYLGRNTGHLLYANSLFATFLSSWSFYKILKSPKIKKNIRQKFLCHRHHWVSWKFTRTEPAGKNASRVVTQLTWTCPQNIYRGNPVKQLRSITLKLTCPYAMAYLEKSPSKLLNSSSSSSSSSGSK